MRLAKQLAVEILTRIEATMPIALETDLFSKVASILSRWNCNCHCPEMQAELS